MDINDFVWVLDESRLSDTIKNALESGKAVLHDGVAYWAKGSGENGILGHIPFKKVPVTEANGMLNCAANASMIAAYRYRLVL
jgi:hypothetical protein